MDILQFIHETEEFIKQYKPQPRLLFIGTKENLSKYVDLIKDYFTVSKGIKTSFKYVSEDILEDKNKIIVVNENEINMKPLKFKHNFDLTNRWDYDTVDVVKKIIMGDNKYERN